MPESFPQMPWSVPASSCHNFYPLDFPCLSHFGAPSQGTGCSLLPRQLWVPAWMLWQGPAPTPLLPVPAHSGNLPEDSDSWFVRHTHAWVPAEWESHSQHLQGWSIMCLSFTLTQTCIQRGPLLQRCWSVSWFLSKGTSCSPLKMMVVPSPQSAPL